MAPGTSPVDNEAAFERPPSEWVLLGEDTVVSRREDVNLLLSGSSVDVIAVRRADGTLACSSFGVKFASSGTMSTKAYESMSSMAARFRASYSSSSRRKKPGDRTNFSEDEGDASGDDDVDDKEEETLVEIRVNQRRVASTMRLGKDGYCRFVREREDASSSSSSSEFLTRNVPLNLEDYHLQAGRNQVRFEVTRQGRRHAAEARIFLWNHSESVVVCDIDGTVTRNDVRGFVDSVVAEAPTNAHVGVCDFFDQISSKAQILYLTSRPLVLADATRTFLANLKQNSQQSQRPPFRDAFMPDGPVILSRTNLVGALYSELVMKTPHEFKTWALSDVRRAFGYAAGHKLHPFKAGFGNKHTDCQAYKAAAIPGDAIFLITADSVVKLPFVNAADAFDERDDFYGFLSQSARSKTDNATHTLPDGLPAFQGYTDAHLRQRIFKTLVGSTSPPGGDNNLLDSKFLSTAATMGGLNRATSV